MNKKYFLILNLILFFFGIFFLFKSNISVTGAVVGVSDSSSASSIIGLTFILISALLFVGGESLEEKIRKIRPKKELLNLSLKQKTFRRKLINLLDLQKPIEPKKIAYLLPQYEKVKYTGEYIPSHNYPIYCGRKGSKEEYFTVDTREVAKIKLGEDTVLLPTHIDIQERLNANRYNKIGRERIDWKKMIKESESQDILNYFYRKRKRN